MEKEEIVKTDKPQVEKTLLAEWVNKREEMVRIIIRL